MPSSKVVPARKMEGENASGKPVVVLSTWPQPGLRGDEPQAATSNQNNLNQLMRSFPKTFPAIDIKSLELLEKVVIVGDANAGKTCLVLRYCDEHYSHDYKSTIGVDFFWQRYAIQQFKFILHIWDTAGQERFRSLSQAYYRGAGACIVAFDLGKPNSLQTAKQWVTEVIKESRNKKEFSMFLVGCKSDMFHAISKEDALKVAKEVKAEYFEVSAKTGENVKWLFERVAAVLFERALSKTVASLKAEEEEKDDALTLPTDPKGAGARKGATSIGGGSGIGDTGGGKGTVNWKKGGAATKGKTVTLDKPSGRPQQIPSPKRGGPCWN